jgi:hypothetical protein
MKSHLIKSLMFLAVFFCIGIILNYFFTYANNIEGYGNSIHDNMRVVVHPYDFFRYNITSPDCCNINTDNRYTNGSGCICITKEQERILQSRGGNNY